MRVRADNLIHVVTVRQGIGNVEIKAFELLARLCRRFSHAEQGLDRLFAES